MCCTFGSDEGKAENDKLVDTDGIASEPSLDQIVRKEALAGLPFAYHPHRLKYDTWLDILA